MRKTDGVEVKFKEIVITANVDLFIYVVFFKSLNLIFKRIVFETENKQLKNEYYLYIYQYKVVIFSSFFFHFLYLIIVNLTNCHFSNNRFFNVLANICSVIVEIYSQKFLICFIIWISRDFFEELSVKNWCTSLVKTRKVVWSCALVGIDANIVVCRDVLWRACHTKVICIFTPRWLRL